MKLRNFLKTIVTAPVAAPQILKAVEPCCCCGNPTLRVTKTIGWNPDQHQFTWIDLPWCQQCHDYMQKLTFQFFWGDSFADDRKDCEKEEL